MHRRTLMKSLIAAPLLGALGSQALAGASGAPARQLARRLQPGMTVGLITPASNAPENEDIRFAADVVRSLGFKVKESRHLYARNQYLAGTDAQRAADVNDMFSDKSVDAIFCMRGGYGTPRILPLLDYKTIGKNPKVLLGYSDITALHNAIHQRTGLVTFHGPIAGQNFTDYTYAEFNKVMMQAQHPVALGEAPPFDAAPGRVERDNRITTFVGGRARGRLIGGNLTLIASVMGTPFQPDFRDAILFLEDVHEAPYRIDRMLTQLWLAGVFDQVAGVVLGKFTDAGTDGNTFSLEQVFEQRFGQLKVPVVRGLMIGHVKDQTIVPVGGQAELDGDSGRLTLTEAVLR